MAEDGKSIFLSEGDVAILTGRKTKSFQIAQLRAMGIPCFIDAAGRPIVARAVIEGTGKSRADSTPPTEPNWKALEELVARGKKKVQT